VSFGQKLLNCGNEFNAIHAGIQNKLPDSPWFGTLLFNISFSTVCVLTQMNQRLRVIFTIREFSSRVVLSKSDFAHMRSEADDLAVHFFVCGSHLVCLGCCQSNVTSAKKIVFLFIIFFWQKTLAVRIYVEKCVFWPKNVSKLMMFECSQQAIKKFCLGRWFFFSESQHLTSWATNSTGRFRWMEVWPFRAFRGVVHHKQHFWPVLTLFFARAKTHTRVLVKRQTVWCVCVWTRARACTTLYHPALLRLGPEQKGVCVWKNEWFCCSWLGWRKRRSSTYVYLPAPPLDWSQEAHIACVERFAFSGLNWRLSEVSLRNFPLIASRDKIKNYPTVCGGWSRDLLRLK
jgi:hypothetical protein